MKSDGENSGHRLQRLQQLLLEELQALFEDELSDPRLSEVRPLAVSLSPDYRHARVHCVAASSGPGRSAIEQGLAKATGFLRRRIADAIELKHVPELRFIVDERADSGAAGDDA
ncbi:MAG: 30S ribosome-binding factor RbfA [Polyangiaceae bacterium]